MGGGQKTEEGEGRREQKRNEGGKDGGGWTPVRGETTKTSSPIFFFSSPPLCTPSPAAFPHNHLIPAAPFRDFTIKGWKMCYEERLR